MYTCSACPLVEEAKGEFYQPPQAVAGRPSQASLLPTATYLWHSTLAVAYILTEGHEFTFHKGGLLPLPNYLLGSQGL